jgi:UDP-4-amino-4,6-dideoxy-N-acetyl-beta-L-altrosamine transaminase
VDRRSFIPYGRHSVEEQDVAAVDAVLRSAWLTCGPAVEGFEKALASYCGARHAVAVSNGTAALHTAMLAAGVGPGDRVLTSSITFLASANCAEFVGAAADFADIDPVTRCVSVETVKAAWGDDVKALIPVDFAGYPCVTREMADVAHERGALVVEDACHAIGSRRDGHAVGALPWVDMTAFSFHPIKTMTTGEGGAVLTDDEDLAERCRGIRNHGMLREPERWIFNPHELERTAGAGAAVEEAPWYYEMHELGYNYRITDLQCALGMSQLRRVEDFVRRRQDIVDTYRAAFARLPNVKLPPVIGPAAGTRAAWHLFVIEVDFEAGDLTRSEVVARMREQGVGTQIHYVPVHLQPYYRKRRGYVPGKCPFAETYYRRCLSLPLFPRMTAADVRRVTDVVSRFVGSCRGA